MSQPTSSLIDKLQAWVTPAVLEQNQSFAGDTTDKQNMLGALYALLVARLSDGETVNMLESLPSGAMDNGSELLGLLFGGFGKDANSAISSQDKLDASGLVDALVTNFNLSSSTVTALATSALPVAYAQLKNLSGNQGLATFLSSERESAVAALPVWLTALVPAGLLGAFGLSKASAAPVHTTTNTADTAPAYAAATKATTAPTGTATASATEGGGFMKSLLPVVGLVIFAGLAWLMLRGCQDTATPVAAPTAVPTSEVAGEASTLTPANFALALDSEGKNVLSCSANAGASNILDNIKAVVSGAFGGGERCPVAPNPAFAGDLPAGKYLPQIMSFMTGVPDASVSIEDKLIRFNAATPEAVAKLIDDTKAVVSPDFVVEAEPVLNATDAITGSISAANAAIDGLNADAGLDELVRALNMQIINFAVGSSEVPAENKAILDKAAAKLASIPDARLKITGHTDNNGTRELNQKLSESRATAVHDYLVSKGVNDDNLDVFGAGFDEPVASNATEQGRFRNRRIEFTIVKDGETVASVGEGVEQAPVEEAVEPTTETPAQ